MQLIKPYFEVYELPTANTVMARIERAGRVCYKSEDKITEDSAAKFCANIVKSGHDSVLEHSSITVKFVCDRGVSHELVRHRLMSPSQESTRYCNYTRKGIVFILPPWVDIPPGEYGPSNFNTVPYHPWYASLLQAEAVYNDLINIRKWTPQQARTVLPNSLKTEVVVTANVREWRHIFRMRTGAGVHPQMAELMVPLLRLFTLHMPILFEDIKPSDKWIEFSKGG